MGPPDSASFSAAGLRLQLVPVWQGEPAGGDHLRQVKFVLGPEFGRGRQQPLAAGSSSINPTRRARASHNEGESGNGTNESAIGAARTGSRSIRSRSRL